MNNGKLEEHVARSFWLSILDTFDAGKAIVAALVVAVLGYLTNLLTSLYGYVYWSSYFACFNLPIQYFESAIDTVSSFYGFVVAVPLSVVHLLAQLAYNGQIKRAMAGNAARNPKRARGFIGWFMRGSTWFLLPLVHVLLCFFLLIILNGGNGFILSVIISSSTMNVLISILLGGATGIQRQPDAQPRKPSKKDIKRLVSSGLIIGITVFLLSLVFVYLLGYFQKVILVDIPQVIAVDSEDTTQEYGLLLETDTNYICAPITYVEGQEFIMHIQNNGYRVIPKDEIVTVTDSDAWALYRDKGAGVLFDFIAYDEEAFGRLLLGTVVFSVILLYGEYLILIKRHAKKQDK